MVRRESASGARVILETDEIVVISPYAPRFPFETLVLLRPTARISRPRIPA
jgi:UDPglucose--hexose-1-phosphate uridylyltransferase